MKHTITKKENTIELAIPYDLVSTRIPDLKMVFKELESIFEAFNRDQLIVDFAGCSMVDSAGLNFLVSLQKFLQTKNCNVKLRSSDKNLIRTFRFSRLDQFMEIISI